MVAFVLTADGMKCMPWTWMAGLSGRGRAAEDEDLSPSPKMKRSVSLSCRPWARSGPAATSVSRSTPSHSRTETSERQLSLSMEPGERAFPNWAPVGGRGHKPAAPVGSAVARALAAHQIHRVLDQVVQDRQPVAHAAGAAGQVHDERPAADPAVPRESAARGNRG